ncbi:NYN domain-containing protein [Candidatus Woesearchaeota archaeon]|nr:NYN domain-containing protein [Candidatus Woesearchaeota archaeon]
MVNKEQRVGVFVDVQNLYYSAKNLYNSKVNFANVLKEVVEGRKLIRAIAYVIKTEAMKEKTFFEALEKIGFDIQAKDLQIFHGGHKKGDWDVGIAMDIIELAPKLDVIILVSGDGDFVPLMLHARSAGCKIEACSFGRSASSKLKETVSIFHDLDKNKNKYLIKSNRRRSSSGRKRSKGRKSSK